MANALKNYLMRMSDPQTTSNMISRQQQLALNRRLAQQRRERLGLEERRQDWAEGGDADIRRMNAGNYAGRTAAQNRRTALQEDQFGFKQQKYNEAPKRAAVMGGIGTMTKSPEGLANLPTKNLGDPDAFKLAAPKMLGGQVRQRSRVAGAETTARESARTQAMLERKEAGLGVDARTQANIQSREELQGQRILADSSKHALGQLRQMAEQYALEPSEEALVKELLLRRATGNLDPKTLKPQIKMVFQRQISQAQSDEERQMILQQMQDLLLRLTGASE